MNANGRAVGSWPLRAAPEPIFVTSVARTGAPAAGPAPAAPSARSAYLVAVTPSPNCARPAAVVPVNEVVGETRISVTLPSLPAGPLRNRVELPLPKATAGKE